MILIRHINYSNDIIELLKKTILKCGDGLHIEAITTLDEELILFNKENTFYYKKFNSVKLSDLIQEIHCKLWIIKLLSLSAITETINLAEQYNDVNFILYSSWITGIKKLYKELPNIKYGIFCDDKKQLNQIPKHINFIFCSENTYHNINKLNFNFIVKTNNELNSYGIIKTYY